MVLVFFLFLAAVAGFFGARTPDLAEVYQEKQAVKKKEAVIPASLVLTGEGQQATNKFSLPEGLVVFEASHSGKQKFAVRLLNDQGDEIELIVDKMGEFSGSKAVKIPVPGDYLLNIDADGKWRIEAK